MTKKVQNIRRNPDKICFSIDDESYPYKAVKGRAVGRISEDIQKSWGRLNTLLPKCL
jgi:hypothetical protein